MGSRSESTFANILINILIIGDHFDEYFHYWGSFDEYFHIMVVILMNILMEIFIMENTYGGMIILMMGDDRFDEYDADAEIFCIVMKILLSCARVVNGLSFLENC